jgi:hypothetical protein
LVRQYTENLCDYLISVDATKSKFGAKLNALVYQVYGLDDADIAVIEGYLGKKTA